MSNEVAVPNQGGVDGLEDIGGGDITTPILNINHKTSMLELNLTGESFSKINCVILGVVKQRILWPVDPGEKGAQPICRSLNFSRGIPGEDFAKVTITTKGGVTTTASGFSPERIAEGDLPCDQCALKEWGAHPKSTNAPWCNEQFVLPILIMREDGKPPLPALFQCTRTSLKPIRNYISGFVAGGDPMYTALTELSLETHKKGTAEYGVAKFVKLGESTPDHWTSYSNQYKSIRQWLTTPRSFGDDGLDPTEDVSAPAQNVASAPAQAAPQAAAPAQAPVEATATEEAPAVAETPRPAKRAEPAEAPAPAAPAVAAVDPDDEPF